MADAGGHRAGALPVVDLVLLSGGIDSAAILAELAASGASQQTLFIDYGQPAAIKERRASAALARFYGVHWDEVSTSPLPAAPGEILGRNGMLIALALSWLGRPRPGCLHLGVHAGTGYSDCSPAFVESAQGLLDLQAHGLVRLVTPFLAWRKETILARAHELAVPLELTYSCESGSECDRCRSCRDRGALLAHSH